MPQQKQTEEWEGKFPGGNGNTCHASERPHVMKTKKWSVGLETWVSHDL